MNPDHQPFAVPRLRRSDRRHLNPAETPASAGSQHPEAVHPRLSPRLSPTAAVRTSAPHTLTLGLSQHTGLKPHGSHTLLLVPTLSYLTLPSLSLSLSLRNRLKGPIQTAQSSLGHPPGPTQSQLDPPGPTRYQQQTKPDEGPG